MTANESLIASRPRRIQLRVDGEALFNWPPPEEDDDA